MLWHNIISAVRNIEKNKILFAISVIGLVLGLTGAMLMGAVTRTALTYNSFLPNSQNIYLGTSILTMGGMPPNYNQLSNGGAAELVKLNVTDVANVTRVAEGDVEIERAGNHYHEKIYWADPNLFSVLRVPVAEGDLDTALEHPDGIVMTRSAAEKYFGTEAALGKTLTVDANPMTVTALIDDLPANATDLEYGVFAAGLSAQSELSKMANPAPGSFTIGARTYMVLKPGADPAAVEARFAPFVASIVPDMIRDAYRMGLVRIDKLPLHEGFFPNARERLIVGNLVAEFLLFIAMANFINLSVAMVARRKREIGIRKALGAGRTHLVTQFLGEAGVVVLGAALVAALAAHDLLPSLNAFLETQATLDPVRDPALIAWFAAIVVGVTVLAGFYPALILSGFQPGLILQNRAEGGLRRSLLRQTLVTTQFAILIGLIVASAVVYQQRRFSMQDALRFDADHVVLVEAACPTGFVQEVAAQSGVRAVSCSGPEWTTGQRFAFLNIKEQRIPVDFVSALPSMFPLYGIAPLAGSFDGIPADGEGTVSRIAINETAMRRFGFASAEDAIGQQIPIPDSAKPGADISVRIVAVMPDFALYSVETAIKPTVYIAHPSTGGGGLVSIKLAGGNIPDALAAIDQAWQSTGRIGPIQRMFVSDHIEQLYRGLARNTQLFVLFSGLTVFLACLGLIALTISAADRRTKEIGIRKAMGASTAQILRRLLWQLSVPVLLANVIAWPVIFWLMRRWLDGFAYHIAFNFWLLPAAGAMTLLFALISAGGQSYLVARRKPVFALRYE
jgi:putative ABC transport system permease protein